jgi:hypothetical protein
VGRVHSRCQCPLRCLQGSTSQRHRAWQCCWRDPRPWRVITCTVQHMNSSVTCTVQHMNSSVTCTVQHMNSSVTCAVQHMNSSVTCAVQHMNSSVTCAVQHMNSSVTCAVQHMNSSVTEQSHCPGTHYLTNKHSGGSR